MKKKGGNFGGLITFDHIETNEGGGFNGRTGRFRAPVAGLYGFSFSGVTSSDISWTRISVVKDEKLHHYILDGNGSGHNNIGGSWMIKLGRGNEVYLKLENGNLYAAPTDFVHFTGQLLKADE